MGDSVREMADRIRAHSTSWSLEGDAEFLRLMSNISNNLIIRGQQTTLAMHKMMLELSNTSVGLNNMTNKLLALQNSQFVENRVQEDDDCQAAPRKPELKNEETQKEPALTDCVQNAFQNGIQMMNKFYDKVTYNFDDSDDEAGGGAHKSVLYLPKNMYKHRHLPYLIGSKEWQENRHIGLIDDDELKTDMNEDDEVLESNEDSSIVDDVSEADDEESIHHHIINRDNESIDSSDRSIIEEFKPAPVRLFYEEATPVDQQSAAAKMRANTLFAQENFRSQYVASNLFDDQPPEIQVAAPTIQKRKPANLFADDESDDDSFSVDVPDRANDLLRDASAPSAVEGASLASGKVEQQTLPARAAPKSLEPKIVDKPKPIIQAENAIFAAAKTENENSPKPPAGARLLVAKEALTSPLFVKAKNLFAEDDFDDDDDLFTSKVVDNKNSISSSEAKPVIRDLFADSELDSSPKLLHASGVRNIFDKLHSARRTANLFAEDDTVDDDDNEIFRTQREANGKGIGGPESETATTSGANEPQPELKKQADVLPPTNQNSQRETAPHRKLNAKMSSLFGDESNDDNDPLFVAEPRLSAPSNTEQKSQSKPNTLKQISLFGDEDDDPFSTPPILAANQSSTKSQLIDDTHKSKTASTPTNRANAANLIAATFKSTNLFADDDLESEDELFKAANRGLNATKVISNVKPENENIVSVTKMPSPEPNNIEEMPTTIASTEEAHKTNEPKDSVIENYSNLTALLGEDPPDETEDIFKSVESGKKESISFIPDSLEDEKSSLFENAESLGSDSNEYAADPEGNIPSANVEKSFNNYSSLQLFNEEPPDDDINKFNVEPTEQTGRRNLIGVFEDSSNNVIDKGTVEGDTIANTYQYMLFTEEPPPMDFDDKLPDESSSRHSDSSPKKSESIDSRASKNSRQSPSRTDKLSKTVTHETSMSSLDDFNAQIAATAPLDSVNKSRARIMTGRRPSTRSGRQQQYEKYSQSSENEEISAPAAPQPILEAATTIEGQSSRSTTSSVVPKFEKKRMFNLLGEQQRELQSKIASELKKRTAILFKDDDESPPADSDGPDKCEIIDKPSTEKNIADLPSIQAAKIEASTSTKSPSSDSLSPVQVPLPPSMKTNLVREATKSKSLFADDSSDEDFFEKHIAKTSLTRKTSTLSTLNTAKAATETLSPQRKDAPEKSLFTTAKTSSSSSKLFSSSEDDDDDLFLTKSKAVKPASTSGSIERTPLNAAETQPKKATKTATLSKAVENPLADLFD